jgi:hypothetical protein
VQSLCRQLASPLFKLTNWTLAKMKRAYQAPWHLMQLGTDKRTVQSMVQQQGAFY